MCKAYLKKTEVVGDLNGEIHHVPGLEDKIFKAVNFPNNNYFK